MLEYIAGEYQINGILVIKKMRHKKLSKRKHNAH